MSKTTHDPDPDRPQPAVPAEPVASRPRRRTTSRRCSARRRSGRPPPSTPRSRGSTTLQARAEAVRRRLQAQQAEHGAVLNALAHRDYTKLHVLLGGALAMELREAVESTRAVFEGRSRAGGKVIDPSVYATLDRVARLIRQVTAADIHRCPPGRPGCALPGRAGGDPRHGCGSKCRGW